MEKPHKKLEAWKQSMDFVVEIYKATEGLPSQEIYGLTNQIRQAAVSIPCNIAEGAARQTRKEFTNFLHIAQGSLSEVDTQVDIAHRLGYLDTERCKSFDNKMAPIDKMLTGLIRHLSKKQGPRTKG